jgi:hypothetical protein
METCDEDTGKAENSPRVQVCRADDAVALNEQRVLVRRIDSRYEHPCLQQQSAKDIRLMPLMFISYGLQYLDRLTFSYGAIMGIRQDLVRVFQDLQGVLIASSASERPRVQLGSKHLLRRLPGRVIPYLYGIRTFPNRQISQRPFVSLRSRGYVDAYEW